MFTLLIDAEKEKVTGVLSSQKKRFVQVKNIFHISTRSRFKKNHIPWEMARLSPMNQNTLSLNIPWVETSSSMMTTLL